MINVNKVITASAEMESFERFNEIIRIQKNMQGWILKRVFIHFSAGCKTNVHVRVGNKGGYIIPDPRITNLSHIFGDNVFYQFKLNLKVREGDEFYIYYKNTDSDSHTFAVEFEFSITEKKE